MHPTWIWMETMDSTDTNLVVIVAKSKYIGEAFGNRVVTTKAFFTTDLRHWGSHVWDGITPC
jgi:hypothetical protein